MTMRRASVVPLLLAAVVQLHQVQAHGFLTAPKVEFFPTTKDPTAYSATIDGPTALPPREGMTYGWGPSVSAVSFTAAFGNSSYKTLREFVMKHQKLEQPGENTEQCGRTKENASVPQPLPEQVVWQHGEGEGFTLSHEGPCEVWCDDERVFHDANCAKTYPGIPARLPYERAKCMGKNRLQIIWLALHEGTKWQVYMNCAPLTTTQGTSTKSPPSTSPGPSLAPSRSSSSASGSNSQAGNDAGTVHAGSYDNDNQSEASASMDADMDLDCGEASRSTMSTPPPFVRANTGIRRLEDMPLPEGHLSLEDLNETVDPKIQQTVRKEFDDKENAKAAKYGKLKAEFGYA